MGGQSNVRLRAEVRHADARSHRQARSVVKGDRIPPVIAPDPAKSFAIFHAKRAALSARFECAATECGLPFFDIPTPCQRPSAIEVRVPREPRAAIRLGQRYRCAPT